MPFRAFRHTFVFALCWVSFALALRAQTYHDNDAYDLLNRHLRARGDLAVQNGLRSVTVSGQTEQEGRSVAFNLFQRDNGQIRYEAQVDGDTLVQAFNGREGWSWWAKKPANGAKKMTPEQLRLFRLTASMDSPLERLGEYAFSARYAGLDALPDGSGNRAHHLSLTSARYGDGLDVWLDPASFLELARQYRPREDAPALTILFEDYRRVDGIWAPYAITVSFQDEVVAETRIEHIELNPGLLSFFFTRPSNYQER